MPLILEFGLQFPKGASDFCIAPQLLGEHSRSSPYPKMLTWILTSLRRHPTSSCQCPKTKAQLNLDVNESSEISTI